MGTEQLLLTSPVSIVKLVGAKFLACMTLFAITLAASALYFIPLFIYGEPNVGKVAGCLIGMGRRSPGSTMSGNCWRT